MTGYNDHTINSLMYIKQLPEQGRENHVQGLQLPQLEFDRNDDLELPAAQTGRNR
jgi:hypothetical protein